MAIAARFHRTHPPERKRQNTIRHENFHIRPPHNCNLCLAMPYTLLFDPVGAFLLLTNQCPVGLLLRRPTVRQLIVSILVFLRRLWSLQNLFIRLLETVLAPSKLQRVHDRVVEGRGRKGPQSLNQRSSKICRNSLTRLDCRRRHARAVFC